MTRICTEKHELYFNNQWHHNITKSCLPILQPLTLLDSLQTPMHQPFSSTCNSLGPCAPDKAYSRKPLANSNLGYDANFYI